MGAYMGICYRQLLFDKRRKLLTISTRLFLDAGILEPCRSKQSCSSQLFQRNILRGRSDRKIMPRLLSGIHRTAELMSGRGLVDE
jgi:hypothetical protein